MRRRKEKRIKDWRALFQTVWCRHDGRRKKNNTDMYTVIAHNPFGGGGGRRGKQYKSEVGKIKRTTQQRMSLGTVRRGIHPKPDITQTHSKSHTHTHTAAIYSYVYQTQLFASVSFPSHVTRRTPRGLARLANGCTIKNDKTINPFHFPST